jgi:hypothetical protein
MRLTSRRMWVVRIADKVKHIAVYISFRDTVPLEGGLDECRENSFAVGRSRNGPISCFEALWSIFRFRFSIVSRLA